MGSMTTLPQEADRPAGPDQTSTPAPAADQAARPVPGPMPKEIDGPAGPEPTRYGDWERKGRVSDF